LRRSCPRSVARRFALHLQSGLEAIDEDAGRAEAGKFERR
jgi:hypothetical protein